MIFDDWSNFLNYSALLPNAAAAIAAFRHTAAPDMPSGSYELSGKLLRASVFDSKTTAELESAVWEIHRDYADIQTMLRGVEVNCRRRMEGLTPTMEFDPEKDYQLFKPELGDALRLTLTPSNFALYWPEEAHLTSFTVGNGVQPIRKIVFKVHKSFFNMKG